MIGDDLFDRRFEVFAEFVHANTIHRSSVLPYIIANLFERNRHNSQSKINKYCGQLRSEKEESYTASIGMKTGIHRGFAG